MHHHEQYNTFFDIRHVCAVASTNLGLGRAQVEACWRPGLLDSLPQNCHVGTLLKWESEFCTPLVQYSVPGILASVRISSPISMHPPAGSWAAWPAVPHGSHRAEPLSQCHPVTTGPGPSQPIQAFCPSTLRESMRSDSLPHKWFFRKCGACTYSHSAPERRVRQVRNLPSIAKW